MTRGLWFTVGVSFWIGTLAVLVCGADVSATPLYSVTAASRCDSCHIEPVGWLEPVELAERHRTVNCSACHVSPTGGGQRTGNGHYYGREVLPMFELEPRPSSFVDTDKYMNQSDIPVHQIKDRLGDIDPDDRLSFGFDGRLMAYKPIGSPTSVFPMQLDLHAWGRISKDFTTYGTIGLQGRRQRTVERPKDQSGLSELITLRNVVLQRELPYNGYVRAGRFAKPYGWRTPDHTVFTQQPLSYDQYAQVFGVEGGINPEFPWANLALFYQGWEAFPGERAQPGVGTSMTAGYRDFIWQLGMSAEYVSLFDARDQITVGPMWGYNFDRFAYLGQLDVRMHLADNAAQQTARGIYTYHEGNWFITQGLTGMVSLGFYRTAVNFEETQRTRVTVGTQWDFATHLQLSTQYRMNLRPGAPIGHEVLSWLHVWL